MPDNRPEDSGERPQKSGSRHAVALSGFLHFFVDKAIHAVEIQNENAQRIVFAEAVSVDSHLWVIIWEKLDAFEDALPSCLVVLNSLFYLWSELYLVIGVQMDLCVILVWLG